MATEQRQPSPQRSLDKSGYDSEEDDIESNEYTNEYVLNVAFISFLGFTILQTIFALIAKSQAMLTDSEAMAVDALTYLFNLLAEHLKHKPYSEEEKKLSPSVRHHQRKLKRLYLELIPPLLSCATLLTVTGFALREAFTTLLGETLDDEDQPDLQLMLFFSGLNLLLDVVNVFCFAKADQAIGLPSVNYTDIRHSEPIHESGVDDDKEFLNRRDSQRTVKMTNTRSDETTPLLDTKLSPSPTSASTAAATTKNSDGVELQQMEGRQYPVSIKMHDPAGNDSNDNGNREEEGVSESDSISTSGDFHGTLELNLNMCSAWTHVCADTLRSAAVLLAAAFASIAKDISPDSADATATIVVSFIIVVSLGPLVQGLYLTAVEIWTITKDEREKQEEVAKEETEISLTL
mmetsp:Transcript_5322/g.7528  ORF Transcript_5322/g.7528 Transcript_5322/m.7528 type:complete len:405 (-) Transcript_5322:1-1215(-)